MAPPHHEFQGIERLLAIMARLRAPEGGCPWDLDQSYETIAPYTIEEAYEVADAIERSDIEALKDELGDLLFQVVFLARLAEEEGRFAFDDVAGQCADKMIRRHPHVFGSTEGIKTADDQARAWEAVKAVERAGQRSDDRSALAGVTRGLPGLVRAIKLQRRAARVGFDWSEPLPILDKIAEELGELRTEIEAGAPKARIEEEIGDLLFAVANIMRRQDLDAEITMARANAKFERRFRAMEAMAADRAFASLSPAEMDALWEAVKSKE